MRPRKKNAIKNYKNNNYFFHLVTTTLSPTFNVSLFSSLHGGLKQTLIPKFNGNHLKINKVIYFKRLENEKLVYILQPSIKSCINQILDSSLPLYFFLLNLFNL